MPGKSRVSIPGSEKALPAQARRVGTPEASSDVQVTLRLRPRTALTPHALMNAESAAPMTRAAFAQTYGANPEDLKQIEEFAHDHGLTVTQSSLERRTVVLSGPLEAVQEAFGVQLHLYALNGSEFRGRSGTISVPADLAGIIEGVFGLDDRPQASPQFRYAQPPGTAQPHTSQPDTAIVPAAANIAGFSPTTLAQAYAFPAAFDGSGQTVAIIELGGGYRKADLTTYFRELGIPAPKVGAVGVNGARNRPDGNPNSADGEVMLDIEVVGATAPGARIAVYFAPNTDAGFLNAVTQATHDHTRAPSVISISWGAPESQWTAQAMNAMSQAFLEAGMLGVSVLCAAGDNGSSDGVADQLAHADFPASSPYATGCGGTRLTLNGDAIGSETVWNNPGHGATGGGVSAVFPLPTYQTGAGVPPSVNPGGAGGRGVPDVSGVADPQTGYRVRVDGVDTVIGGTSAVAPLWAGLVARLNQARGQAGAAPLGFLNPRLYALAQAGHITRDIVQGDNGAYAAGPGWDACTGLGSPDGEALLAALES
ncbi:S53 family peptidase [Deinococcus ruber]|uniref:Kumamolisin n=1 Tax=Deinococcus ruber TaxID=1848197 RepID=A0A918CA99_9DEIO|nr:S53 family peptidase [Deinococcus ruber]GGR13742.1 kumamolisin [Deinococcus ruber]